MNLGKLERFAQMARRELHKQIKARLEVVLQPQSLERRDQPAVVRQLDQEIAETSREKVVARVAYTWFNRFCALRFMDVNGYNRVRVVSPSEGFIQPELLTEAKQGMLPEEWFTENPPALERVRGLLEGRITSPSPEQEAYALLLVAACNSLHKAMPYLFEAINDVTELLLPTDLLSPNAVLTYVRDTLDPETCDSVEVIGWLYQYYISEIKDKVMSAKAAVAPDDIPAVTQLFTPRWIVEYLVENSLGRLWLQNRPQSKLRASMKYYLDEAEPVPFEGPKLSSPKDIRLMDPACGSGHILVYAFDLLVKIYREEGFEDHEIPALILEHNLVGLDIDERAAELASFALTMKARNLSRRFLTNPVQPKVCALSSPSLKTKELDDYMNRVGKDLFSPGILSTLKQWEEAPHFGSLLRPMAGDVSALRQNLLNLPLHQDLVFAPTHAKVLKALEQIALVGAKVHCVVANPPYMGSKGMNANLKKWIEKHYPFASQDLYSAFMCRSKEFCVKEGLVALITMDAWAYAPGFEEFRKIFLSSSPLLSVMHLGTRAFDSISGEVVSTLAYVGLNSQEQRSHRPQTVDLRAGKSEKEKQKLFSSGGNRYSSLLQSDFLRIDGAPLAYWLPLDFLNRLVTLPTLKDIARPRSGLTTSDNDYYLRYWWEVSKFNASISEINYSEGTYDKWVPINGGSNFRRWYGSNLQVLLWEHNGKSLRNNPGATMANPEYQFKPGVTWSKISGTTLSVRRADPGFMFTAVGLKAFPEKDDINTVCGLLNSKLVQYMIPIFSSNLTILSGDIAKYPYIPARRYVDRNVDRLCDIARKDWDSNEYSWGFSEPRILQSENKQPCIASTFQSILLQNIELTREMKFLEEENNRILIETYGLQGELTPEVPLKEITLTVNPVYRFGEGKTQDEYDKLCREAAAKELVSYAVGCLFGRYSLDRPGLILANAGETLEDFHAKVPGARFLPDSDNVIPLLEEDWFEDDLYARLKEWLKVAWGPQTLEQNLSWLEDALGKDLRKYLAREFYKDHVSTYRKRPIYWLFQSPAGSFQALIYLHRYTPDTVGVVLNDYVRQFVAKLEGHRKMLLDQSIDPQASQGQKTKALKELDKVRRQLEDLNDYDRDILFPLAGQRIALDLDDGVRVNYPKLGNALKRIPGLEGEE